MVGVGIEIEKLCVGYDKNRVLHDIDLEINSSEFVALLGSSGCGKTTLLKSLSGFIKPMSGQIRVNGSDVAQLPPEQRNMAMVFQSYALWPHMTVRQNVGYGLKLRGMSKEQINRKVDELLVLLGLADFGDRKVPNLSGGQRQRVALGRALAVDSPILLLDEPLSNLDARIRLSMRHEIRSLQQRMGLTAVHVTHDREEAMVMADRIVILNAGHIAQVGTPLEVYEQPKSNFVATFMGAENEIALNVERANGTLSISEQEAVKAASLSVSNEIGDGGVNWQATAVGSVRGRFRSSAAHLLADGTVPEGHLALAGRVTQLSYPGGVFRYEIESAGQLYMIDDPCRYAVGDAVTICVPAGGLHLYSEAA
ncbi:ABC transporter ATP-binding protein [Pseudovibrio sp. SCP19]|uniref:ABC transporter ATP-binding protein n=1 Tax=Pseudovibrio sp. SCP19 TaxID=3141374 RepID=UPI0033392E12